jgi:hypothetical protein
MKKLIVILLVLISFVGYSQKHYIIYKVRSGPFDGNTRKFDLKERFTTMELVMYKDTMYVSDSARSKYAIKDTTLEQNNSNLVVVSHKAVDEKNRNCVIFTRTSKVTENNSIIVVYNNYVLQYFVTQ